MLNWGRDGPMFLGLSFDIPNGEIRQRPTYSMVNSSIDPMMLGAVDIRLSPETKVFPISSIDKMRFIIIPR